MRHNRTFADHTHTRDMQTNKQTNKTKQNKRTLVGGGEHFLLDWEVFGAAVDKQIDRRRLVVLVLVVVAVEVKQRIRRRLVVVWL